MPLLAGLAVHTADQVNLRVNVIRALNLPDKIDSKQSIEFIQKSKSNCNLICLKIQKVPTLLDRSSKSHSSGAVSGRLAATDQVLRGIRNSACPSSKKKLIIQIRSEGKKERKMM